MTTETWKPWPTCPDYEVSNQGNVRSRKNRNGKPRPYLLKKFHKPANTIVYVSCPSKKGAITVHKLVLESFVGKRPAGMECRHLDGNPSNNVLENITWGTHSENMQDKIRHGTHQRGTRNNHNKLSREQVFAARRMIAAGVLKIKDIASLLGVTPENISHIKIGKNWGWLQGETVAPRTLEMWEKKDEVALRAIGYIQRGNFRTTVIYHPLWAATELGLSIPDPRSI